MQSDSSTTTKSERYALAGLLLILGTILIQFEPTGPRFIAVLAIVVAVLLIFHPGMLNRLTGVDRASKSTSIGTEER